MQELQKIKCNRLVPPWVSVQSLLPLYPGAALFALGLRRERLSCVCAAHHFSSKLFNL